MPPKETKNLHEDLKAKYPLYEKWHAERQHKLFHWLIFVLVAGFVASALVIKIEVDFSTSMGQGIYEGPLKKLGKFPDSVGGIRGEVGDRVLVKFAAATTKAKRDELKTKYNLNSESKIDKIDVEILGISDEDTPDEVVQKLKSNEKRYIQFAEVDALVAPDFIPNDPEWSNQWEKQIVNDPAAWDLFTGSSSLTVGIADTGVDCTHPDLTTNCVSGWNFYNNNSDASDVYGHGTKVAGTVAAIGNNSQGVAGNVWRSKIMPLRISGPDGYASYSAMANAVIYAADHGAKVVNISYQASGSSTVRQAGNYMRQKGGLVSVSAGNYGANTGYSASPDLIVVSATDPADNLYSWSSFGNDVDFAGPGCTLSTLRGGTYGGACGTSFSAPATAGVLMLIFSANASLSADQAENYLKSSAKDLGSAGFDIYYGWGRIDAGKAIELVTSGSVPPPPPPPPPPPEPSTVSITSYQVSSKTATSATITWTTNISSTGAVYYGTGSGSLNLSVAHNTAATSHSVTLTGLKRSTKYYYKIMATSEDGTSTATSPVSNFRTLRK